MLDIITVTYNSEKWLNGYFNSLLQQKNFDLKKINIILLDNQSKDNTLKLLRDYREKNLQFFNDIVIISSPENIGFGKGNNEASKYGKFDNLLFLNIDIYLNPDNMGVIEKELSKNEIEFGAWELRQMPYEHSKYYDPVTLETSWASAAGLIIRRELFEKITGFDPNFFMYCEDVDISWRIRLEGKKIKYLPNCPFYHYTYSTLNEIKELQYIYGIINNLFLRIKFGNKADINKWIRDVKKILSEKGVFEHARKKLVFASLREIKKLPAIIKWRYKNNKKIKNNTVKKFIGLNYELNRIGDLYYTILPKSNKLVSILVRTYKRPFVLARTLTCLRNQTYKNFEIVIVEDGENHAEELVKRNFSDLNINYYSTTEKVGRCKAGNIAMHRSKGDFLCFLDDDDYLYPDYIETMLAQFERNPDTDIINSLSYRYEVETKSIDPYKYEIKNIEVQDSPIFNLIRMCHDNFYPIQSIMFKRKLYQELGGFDEALDYYEDWTLWLKYTSKYPMYSVLKVCSIFKIPADKKTQLMRDTEFKRNRKMAVMRQQNIKITLDPKTLVELLKKY